MKHAEIAVKSLQDEKEAAEEKHATEKKQWEEKVQDVPSSIKQNNYLNPPTVRCCRKRRRSAL